MRFRTARKDTLSATSSCLLTTLVPLKSKVGTVRLRPRQTRFEASRAVKEAHLTQHRVNDGQVVSSYPSHALRRVTRRTPSNAAEYRDHLILVMLTYLEKVQLKG